MADPLTIMELYNQVCQPQEEVPEEEKENGGLHSFFNYWLCGLGYLIKFSEPSFFSFVKWKDKIICNP